jgi:hypothetical protein
VSVKLHESKLGYSPYHQRGKDLLAMEQSVVWPHVLIVVLQEWYTGVRTE